MIAIPYRNAECCLVIPFFITVSKYTIFIICFPSLQISVKKDAHRASNKSNDLIILQVLEQLRQRLRLLHQPLG
ncbi:MAG: hypothetical protein MJ237_09655, partial [bacterium]|nr:hypothetical protein [bacterium]